MRTILALLLVIAATVHAQPVLRLVATNEYGPGFRGTFGGSPLDCFGLTMLWPEEIDQKSNLPEPTISPSEPRRIMRYNVELVNVGNQPFQPGNTWLKPRNYKWLDQGLAILGLYSITISDTNGNVVRERLGEWTPHWDTNPAIPGLPAFSAIFDPAISPGRAAITGDEYFAGALIDTTGIPDGLYVLAVVVDPLNAFNQFADSKTISHWVRLEAMECKPVANPFAQPPRAIPASLVTRPRPSYRPAPTTPPPVSTPGWYVIPNLTNPPGPSFMLTNVIR